MRVHRPMIRISAALAITLAALAGATRPASAQLPGVSAAAFGMGDNYTALARGRSAAAWNPAGLAMPDNPSFSLGLVQLRGELGIGPLTPADFKEFAGMTIPAAKREEWLETISEHGALLGTFGGELSVLTMNIGALGLQFSTTVSGSFDVSPDVAELIFFGNAGRTGEPRNLSLDGSTVDLAATSTVALSYALPLRIILGPFPEQRFALGATAKYIMGTALISGRDAGSLFNDDPPEVDVSFPFVQTDLEQPDGNGTGFGLDVGAAWQGGPFSAGVMVRNIINTFAWNEDAFWYRRGTAVFNTDSTTKDVELVKVDENAPEEIRARVAELVEEMTFKPSIAFGAAVRAGSLTIAADVRRQLNDGLDMGPRTHAGIGAELRLLPFLPIRAGASSISGGHQISAGVGLEFGILNLGLGVAQRDDEFGTNSMGMFTLSFGGS